MSERNGAGRVYESPPPLSVDTRRALEAFGLATACVALPPVDVRARVLGADVLHRVSGRGCVAGAAVTAWNVWGNSAMTQELFQMTRPGDVLVLAGDTVRALWGENATHRALPRGVRAAIVDGVVRDVDAIRETAFSLWAARVHIGEGERFAAPGVINAPMTVKGAVVEPGDAVVADADGIGFLPRAMLDDLLRSAETRHRTDLEIVAALKRGETAGPLATDDAFQPWRAGATWNEREQPPRR
jgi:regulator of RNase E activity RraA